MSKSQDWHEGRAVGLREGKDHSVRTLANLIYGEYPQPVKQAGDGAGHPPTEDPRTEKNGGCNSC